MPGDPGQEGGLMTHPNEDRLERLVAARRRAADNPLDGKAHTEFGIALAESGQRLQALDAFRRAIWLAPEDPLAHQELALVYNTLEEWGLATKHHLMAVLYGATDMATIFELGWSALHDGDSFLETDAYKLIEEIGRQLIELRIRDGKLKW